jgi:Ca2+-binding RTX toxin-like protein
MANITGTEGIDTLTGTATDDTIQGLGGDDRIIGSFGVDKIDGGVGNDTLDFSKIGKDIFLGYTGTFVASQNRVFRFDPSEIPIYTEVNNVETFIGDPSKSNTINDFSSVPIGTGIVDVNLSTGKVGYTAAAYSQAYPSTTYTVKNFDNIRLINSSGRFTGNNRNNNISAGYGSVLFPGTTSVIVGSKGDDTLSGGTIDYSNLSRAVKVFAPALVLSNFQPSVGVSIDKGNFGTDKIGHFDKIIGATNKANALDLSTIDARGSVDLNLATNSLKVSNLYGNPFLPDSPLSVSLDLSAQVVNFVDAIGGKSNDKIVGDNKNSKLTGGGGNDTIIGGNQNDRITGTDSTARGIGECDTLTGGGGRDKFILGDQNGAYYVGKGNNDYALITDFDLFKDSISIGSLKNYSFALEGNNTIELYSGKDVNTRDLIAKIQLAGGISSANSNSRSIAGSSSNLDSIISKLDIISETNATANS